MALKDDLEAGEDINAYVQAVSLHEPEVLAALRAETARHPSGGMQITPLQGQFFRVICAMTGAKKALDIGTFTGYSSTALALALPPDGKVVTLDISEDYTRIARKYWKKAGIADKVTLRLAPGDESMQAMLDAGEAETFDLAFLDTGNKRDYPKFYELALKLLRPGGVMMVDNVLFGGSVAQAAKRDGSPRDTKSFAGAIAAFNKMLHDDPRLVSVMLTIGDGMSVGVKRGGAK